jgi:hypothetical protein
MVAEPWHEARLIPVSGITGADEQERRGTSALLAVIGSVKEFGRALTTGLGAPVGAIQTYIEVPFQLGDRLIRPDGLIRVTRGQRAWTALVEVKTGKNPLKADQLENYLDVAKAEGFDALLTISNEIPTVVGLHPTVVDKRKLKKVSLKHLSWSQIRTEAMVQTLNRTIADADQAWILSELIRYLEHPRSGAVDFEDMGSAWVPGREAVTAGTARAADAKVAEVAGSWEKLMQFASMQLGRKLGREVLTTLSRRERDDPAIRIQQQSCSLAESGLLTGSLRIPDTAGSLDIAADLRAGRVSCTIAVDAPREGKPLTRVNWLLRQLKDAPDDVRIDVFVVRSRGTSRSELLGKVRTDPSLLVDDAKREIRSFTLTRSRPAGAKRGQGKGSFVGSTVELVDSFYEDVVQRLKPWAPTPPRVRQPDVEPETPQSAEQAAVSTAMSSQDEDHQLAPAGASA